MIPTTIPGLTELKLSSAGIIVLNTGVTKVKAKETKYNCWNKNFKNWFNNTSCFVTCVCHLSKLQAPNPIELRR